MAISDEGKLYAWGFSSEYRTGLGTEDSVETPTLLKRGSLASRVVSFVACGGQFSIATSPSVAKPARA
jgi:alpha-tubulin suppressor-like RCC1 family protein